MIGETMFAILSAIPGLRDILSDGRLIVLLATQATCCTAAALAASYLWQHRAARAHQALLIGLLASVAMPMSYLLVRHLGLGILTPQTPDLYSRELSETSGEQTPAETGVAGIPAWSEETGSVGTGDEELFDDSPAIDPTEPDFADGARIEAADAGAPWPATFMACSLIAGLMLFGRLVWQFLLGRRLVAGARPVEADDIRNALDEARTRMGVAGPIQLRSSREVRSPLIWCWGREPVLLVHRQKSRRPPHCDWVGIFCHELAHWKRLDHITGLFCELLLCAAPWHPLLWWARRRLATLSEEACDDWVLAGGRVGVDYAESLLGLSPQAQLAFLPTVVGKEKAMKERICRILKDRCGNPRAGRRWALVVGVVALGTSVTVALAQPSPPVPPGPGESAHPAEVNRPARGPQARPEQRQLALEGRRNVLNRMLENLRDQRRHTEAELQERGDKQDDATVILRSELMAIQGHIEMVQRQLQNLNQPPRQPGARPAARVEQRLPRLQNRISEAEARLKQLEEKGQGDSEQARQVRENLEQARQQMRAMREQGNAGPGGPLRVRPEPLAQPGARRPEQIQERIRQLRQELEDRAGDRATQLREEIRQLRSELQEFNREPGPGGPAAGAARPQPQLQNQVQQLQDQMNNLNRQMEQMQRTLNQLVRQRPEGEPQPR